MKWIGQIVNDVKVNFSNDGEIYVIADDLYIENVTQDKDIIFKTNDGGTATEVMRIDGSTSNIGIGTSSPSHKLMVLSGTTNVTSVFKSEDNQAWISVRDDDSGTNGALFGTDTDAGHSIVLADQNAVKRLVINNSGLVGIGTTSPASKLHVSGTVQVGVDDTGHDVKFFGATSGKHLLWDQSDNSLKLTDGTNIKIGTDSDLQLSHDGSNSHLVNYTGDYKITQNANDKDIIFNCDDGSGGNTAYLTLDGSRADGTFTYTTLPDNGVIAFGASVDMQLYHDATDSIIRNNTGDLKIINFADDKDILFQSDDGSGGTETYFFLDGSNGLTTFPDNKKLGFGNASDLQIYHDGSNSFIQDTGTGDLYVDAASNFFVRNYTNGEVWIKGTDGGVSLRYQDNQKIITTNTGIDVTGEVKGDSLDIDGDADISGNLTGVDTLTATTLSVTNYGLASADIPNNGADTTGNAATATLAANATNLNATDDRDMAPEDYGYGNDFRVFFTSKEGLEAGSGTGSNYMDAIYLNTWIDASGHDANVLAFDKSTKAIYHYQADQAATNWGTAKQLAYTDSVLTTAAQTNITSLGTLTSLTVSGNTQLNGTLTVGVDDTGHDVKFFGATSGRYLLWDESEDTLRLQDTTQLKFGDGSDMSIYHTSGQNWIDAYSGQLNIRQLDNDADITFQSDDQSGGLDTYFYLDGSTGYTRFEREIILEDSIDLNIGTGQDLRIFHNGTDSAISNNTGDLYIKNETDDGDIIFQSDDGSGGVTTYMTINGGAAITTVSREMRFFDNVKLKLGSGPDLEIYHDASNSYINQAGTGHLYIRNTTDDKDIIFQSDDGSGGITAYLTLDGSDPSLVVSKKTILGDNVFLYIGSNVDLRLHHDGSNSYIQQTGTGDLYIQQNVDDRDIVFQSDDGSGGVETYFKLDGSTGFTQFPDSKQLTFGAGDDLKIQHNGTNSEIGNFTGSLTIYNHTDNGDINFQADDGSGGLATYFFLDGSQATHNGSVTTSLYTNWPDKSRISMGTSHDLQMEHDGTDSNISNYVGDFYIQNQADDKDIIFKCDNGSGGTTAYLTLDGSSSRIEVAKNMRIADSVSLLIGGSGDLTLLHDGSNSYINANGVGDLYIKQNNNDKDIIFQSDDGSGGVTAYLTIDGSAGTIEVAKTTRLADSVSLKLGSATDLELFHDGTNSFINNNTGPMFIRQNVDDGDIRFQSDDGSGGVTDYLKLDGGVGATYVYKDLKIQDSVLLKVGSSDDLQIYHNGTNSNIINFTGDLVIRNGATDKDVILQCDDGSGGETAYLTLDGSAGNMKAATNMRFSDSKQLQLGDSGDLTLQHDGSASYISNSVGNVFITQNANDGDIFFKSDDGSGGTAIYLTLDGSEGHLTVQKEMNFEDSVRATFGNLAGGDMAIYHDGTNNYHNHYTGDVYFRNNANDKDIIFQSDDGSGGVETYFFLDGSSSRTVFPDSKELVFGTDVNLLIWHNATDSLIQNYTSGDLYIDQRVDDKDLVFRADDGSGGTTAYLTLDGSSGYSKAHKHILYQDDVKAMFGTSGDMQILHDGSNSYISQNVTGDLYIENNATDGDVIFRSDDGSGGTTAYLTLDGSAGTIVASKPFQSSNVLQATPDKIGNITIQRESGSGSGNFNVDALGSYILSKTDGSFGVGTKPSGSHNGTGFISLQTHTGNYFTQLALSTNTNDLFIRSANNASTFSSYERLVKEDDVILATDLIKVLPHHFMSNEDGGANKSAQFRDDTIIGVRTSADDAELYAFVEIPYGKTARTVTVYGNDTSLVVNVFKSDINAGALTDITNAGGCVVGTECDIVDTAYSATNYLVIKVTTVNYTNDVVYGAVVTIG